jgi:hypothetical protein
VVTVTKSANPTSIAEPGGPTSLDGVGTCRFPQTIAPLGSYSCWFQTVSFDGVHRNGDCPSRDRLDAGPSC